MRSGMLMALLALVCLGVSPGVSAEPPAGQAQVDTPPDTVAFIGPRMHVDTPVFDFGQVEQGEQVTHDFRFTNRGNRDLRVQSVKTSCGCTAAVIAADTIQPGMAGTIQATFDTKRFAGHKAKNIRVHTNDPLSPVTTLTLQGEIATEFQVQPAQVYLGRLQRGVPTDHTVSVLFDANKSLEITDISNTHPALSIRAEAAQVKGKKGKTLQLRVSKTAPRGPLKDTITVTTTSPKKPTLSIPVVGHIEGDVIALPAQVSFGVIRQRVRETRTVRIKNRSAQPLSIGQVHSSLDTIVPELTEVIPGKEFALRLHISADTEPGRIRGRVEVMTDHPEETQLTIPLFGLVSTAQQDSR